MTLTDAEKTAGVLSAERHREATRTFREAGLLVLENVYDFDFLDTVRAAYDAELETYLAERGGLDALNGKTFGKNHIGFFPPLKMPLADVRIAAHPMVVQLLTEILAPDFQCCFYHTNTALPGSGTQPVHRDSGPLFGTELGVPHPTTHVVLNIALCDFTEENGSTEFWPGTHLIVDRHPDDAKAIEKRAAGLPSVRLNLPLGSLALRDLRAFHRGMPNQADYARTMFAIVYERGWLAAQPMQIPQSVWDTWPENAQKIYRRNRIVPDADYAAMTWEERRG